MITAVLYLAVGVEAVVLCVCFLLLPRFSEAGILFTVAVHEGVATSSEGLRIRSGYRRIIVVGTVVGALAGWIVLAALQLLGLPIETRLVALLATGVIQQVAMYYGVLKARHEAQACLSSMAFRDSTAPLDARRAASLTERRPAYDTSLWIGPFAMLALAVVLFRGAQISLWANAALLLGTAGTEVLLFILFLEIPKFRRLHVSGEPAERESVRHAVIQWATLLGSYLSSWHVLTQWAMQKGLVSVRATFLLTLGPFVLLMAFVWVRFVWTFRGQLTKDGSAASAVGDKTPERGWFLGLLYWNKADPAIFVRERWGAGWTMNLGNPVVQVVAMVSGVLLVTVLVVKRLLAVY